MLNPTQSTQISAVAAPAPLQTVVIDPGGWTPCDEVDALLLFQELGEAAINWAAVAKAKALRARVKTARGKIAQGQLKLAAVPRVPSTEKVLRALAARAKAQKKDLLEVLLAAAEAIDFGKKKLEEHFSKIELETLCEDGTAPAPSMPISARGDTDRAGDEPCDPAIALSKLTRMAKDRPGLFTLPAKGKKVEIPKARYVWPE